MPSPNTLIRPPYQRQPKGFLSFLVEEMGHKDLWLMILGSALMTVSYKLRTGARDNIYWRIHE